MNKVLLVSLLMAGTVSVSAQTWEPAPTPSMNMEAYPAGMSSVELMGSLKINRQCPDFVTLEKDGVVVKQIPASNKVAVYTYEGFTKFTNDEPGSLHVTFWNDLKTSPYQYTGTYKVTFPAGFFTYTDGTPNEEMSAEWGIDNAQIVMSPATGEILKDLKVINLEFPGADKVEVAGSVTIDFDYVSTVGSEDGDEPLPTMSVKPVVNGTKGTLEMPAKLAEYIEQYGAGTVKITYGTGVFKVWYNGSETPSLNWLTSGQYTIASVSDAQDGGYGIVPEQGEVYQFPSAPIEDNNITREVFFIVYPPKGKEIKMVTRASAGLYAVIDGQREKTPVKQLTGVKYNCEGGGILFYDAGNYSEPSTLRLAPGVYQLVVGKNADYTNRNPELVFNYTVLENPNVAPIATVVSPSTEKPVAELNVITVSFPEAKEVVLKKGSYAIVNMGNIEYTASAALNTEGECPVVEIIPYAPFVTEGTYQVSIPAANISVDDVNYGINLKYEVQAAIDGPSGVEAVEAAQNVDVYSIDGRVVARNASLDVVKALKPGLYIVGGHKVLVK